jgi:membrane protein YqaA with SNARE-associated domain
MGALEILGSTCLGGILTAFIPGVTAEVLLFSALFLGPGYLAIPCAVSVSVGQMVGKAALYLVSAGALRLPWAVSSEKVQKAVARLENAGRPLGLIVFTSAATGLPPFTLTTVGAGALRVSFPLFMGFGLAGRLVRFTSLALFPGLAQGILP